MTRPSWDEYFLGFLPVIGARGTCDRGKSGSLAVRNRQILTTGYVGAPPGFPHCDEAGHDWAEIDGILRCVRTLHAEQNTILQAARLGISLQGCTFYSTMEPCHTCAMMLVSIQCKRVVSLHAYHAADRDTLIRGGIIPETMSRTLLYDTEETYAPRSKDQEGRTSRQAHGEPGKSPG